MARVPFRTRCVCGHTRKTTLAKLISNTRQVTIKIVPCKTFVGCGLPRYSEIPKPTEIPVTYNLGEASANVDQGSPHKRVSAATNGNAKSE